MQFVNDVYRTVWNLTPRVTGELFLTTESRWCVLLEMKLRMKESINVAQTMVMV